jgi:xanthine dehydrogenase accessory factor
MGSQRITDQRARQLCEDGFTDDELARLHAPIGLPIGARRDPGEIAVSICAEVIATMNLGRRCRRRGRPTPAALPMS